MTRHRTRLDSRGGRVLGLAVAGLTVLAAGTVGLMDAAVASSLPDGCTSDGSTVTCTYLSGASQFVVPAGVLFVNVVAVGGKGGDSDDGDGVDGVGTGGYGARVAAMLAVTSGDALWATVGGNGEASASRLAVAGLRWSPITLAL